MSARVNTVAGMPRKSRITDAALIEAVPLCFSYYEVLRMVSTGASGSMHAHIKRRIENLALDTSHFRRWASVRASRSRDPLSVFVVIPDEGRRLPRSRLLRAMTYAGIPYRCHGENCPNPDPSWRGEALALEIEHIDGNWRNCLRENLTFLCPNCHAQTPSNNRSRSRPPKADWLNAVLCECSKAWVSQGARCRRCRDELAQARGRRRGETEGLTQPLTLAAQAKRRATNPRYVPQYPPVEELAELVRTTSYKAVGRSLGVSDVAVRKRVVRCGYDPKSLRPVA